MYLLVPTFLSAKNPVGVPLKFTCPPPKGLATATPVSVAAVVPSYTLDDADKPSTVNMAGVMSAYNELGCVSW